MSAFPAKRDSARAGIASMMARRDGCLLDPTRPRIDAAFAPSALAASSGDAGGESHRSIAQRCIPGQARQRASRDRVDDDAA
jgi:hypothetical protein